MNPNVNYCGIVLLLRQLVAAGCCTKKEAARIADRIAKQTGAVISDSSSYLKRSVVMFVANKGGDQMATQMDNLARKQIYIPAAQPQEELALRVAAYCRVSSDSEDQLNSFAAQTTHYHQLIANHESWLLADIYADEGITGTSTQKRKDFQRLLADCRKGKIDKILVKSISRFARNTTDCLETIRELRSLGISVFFEEHNIDTKLMGSEILTAVLASCAQTESESISKNTRWGVQKRMAQGTYIASSAPYGFRLADGILVIQQDEAAVIRRIFDAYLTGLTPAEIADRLNGTGNTDRSWWESTVKYILRNERYTC